MNKNLFRAGVGIVVGGALLITSTVMSIADGPSGYETLKAAVKNSKNIESATLVISGYISDNGKDLIKMSSTFKENEKEHLLSGEAAVRSDKINKNFTLYASENQLVFKDDASQIYNKISAYSQMNGRIHKQRNDYFLKHEDPQMEKIGEKIIDTLVGDLKKQVVQKDIGNGEKNISITLDKNEVPSLVNLVLSAKANKECDKQEKVHEILGISKDDFKVPELVSDIRAEKIDVEVVVDNNNLIKELNTEIDITGKDAENNIHNQDVKLNVDISGVNTTKVDTINLDGKNVKIISRGELGCR